MSIGASHASFLPDKGLEFRAIGATALTAAFASTALDLVKLLSRWTDNAHAFANEINVAVGIESLSALAAQHYTFALEIDNASNFPSATVVTSVLIDGQNAVAGTQFALSLTRETLEALEGDATHMRLTMTPLGGAETGTIAISAFLLENDRVTLSDGITAGQVVKIGTMQTGTLAFGAVMDDADTITINDGVNVAVVFTFGDGTGGTVAKGGTATTSAQNLKTAIEAKVTANLLKVSVSGGAATLTLKNLASFTLGAITKSDGDNDVVVTNWTGGVAGVKTQQMLLSDNPAAVYTDQVELFKTAVAALNSSTSFSATRSVGTITVTNLLAVAGGAKDGTIAETADAGSQMTVTDFSVAAASIAFWAYVRGCPSY